ncbi:hypothetical protein [Cryptosporangium sp. NPDC051539]|uniref:hypothetical protein n=1 Tax=Cryptosporangium sp. NPDC051539 TaxID=3363962 RepID=UPI0037BBE0C6
MATEQLVFDVFAKASGTSDVQKLGSAIDDVGKAADKLDKKSTGGNLFTKLVSAAKDAGSKIGSALSSGLSSAKNGAGSAASGLGSFFKSIPAKALEAGKDAGQKLGSAINDGLKNLGPGGAYVGGAIVASAVAAAPLLSAAITGALIAGVAAAGIGAAIALQVKDNPELLRIWGDLGTQIKTQLTQATSVFGPQLIASAQVFRATWNSSVNDVRQFFANLAGDGNLTALATKLGSGFQDLIRGASELSVTFKPVLDALGTGLAGTLSMLGNSFSQMSSQGAAAATALQLIFGALNGSLGGILQTITGLTGAFGWLAEHGILGPEVAASYDAYKQSIDNAKVAQSQLGTATQQTTSLMQEQANALKAQTDPVFALMQSQQQLTTAQKALADATSKYGADSQQAKDASLQLSQAVVGMQDSSAKAADAGFDGKLTPAMKRAMEAAHLSKEEIAAIEKAAQDAHAALEQYDGTYTAHVVTVYEALGDKAGTVGTAPVGGLFKGYARGGIDYKMAAGGTIGSHFVNSPTVMYGERGVEAYIGKDAPRARSRAIATTVVEDWLGGRVTWPGASNPGAAGVGSRPGSAAALDLGPLLTEMRLLRLEVARSGGRDVYLDGRLVGSQQGREANRLAREY